MKRLSDWSCVSVCNEWIGSVIFFNHKRDGREWEERDNMQAEIIVVFKIGS